VSHGFRPPSSPSPSSRGKYARGGAWNLVTGNHPSTGPLAKDNPAGFLFSALEGLAGRPVQTEVEKMQIDFEKMGGLAPAIVQDANNGEVLMLGFMNQEAFEKTLATGYVTFYSRTRNKLWTKGETSGNRLRLTWAATDCDTDTILCKVEVEGDGLVCHEGTRSCFTKPMAFTEATRG
jgi:phosphoribosyl-ATP pyrophosphohydrolase/phosphoribosyl-AMP cyclohydrolase